MSRIWGESQQLLIEQGAFSISSSGQSRRVTFEGSPSDALGRGWDSTEDLVSKGGRCRVLLADALVRYLVIRWPAGLRGSSERAALVAHRFREVHALTTADWTIKIEPSVAGVPVLACAVPIDLLKAMVEWARAGRVRLVGVTSEFVGAYNRLRGRITHPLGALAVQRDTRVTIGLWRDASWQAVRSQPCVEPGEGAPGIMLEMLRAQLEGMTPDTAGVLYCVGGMREPPAGWRALSLDEST